uniref:CENP-V/GFA domain-containing protein n=1 Tax=Panagrolaimus sp. JU765 TaxID=591449 RepID=A0AC34QWB3_9BILA
MQIVEHFGSCHCGAVQWSCVAPDELEAITCNENFKLIKGEDQLTTYKFNQKIAQHKFCKNCGVQSFYFPRSNPDSVGIMPHCIDSPTVKKLVFTSFDGQNWEKEMETKAPVAFKSL